jgi:hypothetical protein
LTASVRHLLFATSVVKLGGPGADFEPHVSSVEVSLHWKTGPFFISPLPSRAPLARGVLPFLHSLCNAFRQRFPKSRPQQRGRFPKVLLVSVARRDASQQIIQSNTDRSALLCSDTVPPDRRHKKSAGARRLTAPGKTERHRLDHARNMSESRPGFHRLPFTPKVQNFAGGFRRQRTIFRSDALQKAELHPLGIAQPTGLPDGVNDL